MTREQKRLERKQRKAKVRAQQYAAAALLKQSKGHKKVVKHNTKENGYKNAGRIAKANRKRAEAIIRQTNWAKLSIPEQIIELKERRGNSKKQLERLNNKCSQPKSESTAG